MLAPGLRPLGLGIASYLGHRLAQARTLQLAGSHLYVCAPTYWPVGERILQPGRQQVGLVLWCCRLPQVALAAHCTAV